MVPPRYGRQAEEGRPFVATGQRARGGEKSNLESAYARWRELWRTRSCPLGGHEREAKRWGCTASASHCENGPGRSACALGRVQQHGYRIKPHGQLVLVSLRPYSPSTPSLSTSWSWTTLQGGQASGKTNLQASFPLRCFQRLSLPHVATRRCHWRDNRYTRGASTPVLSY